MPPCPPTPANRQRQDAGEDWRDGGVGFGERKSFYSRQFSAQLKLSAEENILLKKIFCPRNFFAQENFIAQENVLLKLLIGILLSSRLFVPVG